MNVSSGRDQDRTAPDCRSGLGGPRASGLGQEGVEVGAPGSHCDEATSVMTRDGLAARRRAVVRAAGRTLVGPRGVVLMRGTDGGNVSASSSWRPQAPFLQRLPAMCRLRSPWAGTLSRAARGAVGLLLCSLVLAAPLGAHPHPLSASLGDQVHRHSDDTDGLVEPLEADISLKELNAVLDAPWCVAIREGETPYLPVLFFFPETKKKWRNIKITRLAILERTGDEDEDEKLPIWEDGFTSPPVVARSPASGLDGRGAVAVDPFGRVSRDLDIVKDVVDPNDPNAPWQVDRVHDENRGWHIILRLPITPVAGASLREIRDISIEAQVDYRRLDDPDEDDEVHSLRRRLFVRFYPDGLPEWPGWRYYDTHIHSAAEYGTNLSMFAVRKSFGGPVQMLKEAAYAIGMIPSPGMARDRVIVTDHNVFYSDDDIIKTGPTSRGAWQDPIELSHPELSPYFTMNGTLHARGQKEYENYLDEFGITLGEEVTLQKTGGFLGLISGTLGSHMLTYSTRHFMGPFHGGRFFVFKNEPNPNPLAKVLRAMSLDENFNSGFAYAAHPFSRSSIERKLLSAWNEDEIKLALRGEYVHLRDGRPDRFVFKGFQAWNGKLSRHLATNTVLPRRTKELLADPTWHREWVRGSPNWDDRLQYGLQRWHQLVTDYLSFAFEDDRDARFVRKFYLSGGTDAHGDFNRDSGLLARGLTALPAQIMRFLKIFSMSSNAFGKVRTAVDTSGIASGPRTASLEEKALEAYARGQTVVTDGPLLCFKMDSNGNFDGRRLQWHAAAAYEDDDGQIGGAGVLDGARTMLVAEGTESVLYRYRWTNNEMFGGPLRRIEIYKDEAGKTVELDEVERNTGPAKVLRHHGELDPEAPADGDGWRIEAMGETRREDEPSEGTVEVPTALSLGGFTERGDEPPYDHRCYTNPIWALPVRVVAVRRTGGGGSGGEPLGEVIPKGSLSITFRFAASMKPEECEVRLVPLDEAGDSVGQGIRLYPEGGRERVHGWSRNEREDLVHADYTVTNRDDIVDLAASADSGVFCVILVRPSDNHGNRLNSVAKLLDLTRL